ncbi:sensor histidine kinase [Fibrella forsythiae]|uniref:Histidine kinase n=1 Tax=Fibrella forsythiae TaxID=2817061 RepID=A0ABS3JUH9_9BACT|nr:sensor histidine kinase [Fibrella forsythiae]MBO0953056.1 histidine kinase [Fibrella forsythiae]
MAYLLPVKLPRPLFTRPEAWYHLLWLPVVYPVAGWLLIGERYFSQLNVFVVGTLTMLIIHAVDLLVLTVVVKSIIAHYAGLQQVQQRNGLALGVGTLMSAILSGSSVWICGQVPLLGTSFSAGVVLSVAGVGTISALLMGYVLIVTDTYKRWQEDQAEKQQLRQLAMQQQIDALKGQINPHFLFNSLNSVSSLIADEPQQAEAFVDQMAKVYRYLLQANRQTDDTGELTTLATEMSFIRSYLHLLKTRYGPGIRLEVALDEPDLNWLLPPLTLLQLVENAVKHNVIYAHKPLTIEIKSEPAGRLLVRNNLQRKTTRVLSNQVGISNITAKYRLLAQPQVGLSPEGLSIAQTDSHFSVSLPLLNPAV